MPQGDVTQTAIKPRFLYNFSAFDGATITSNSDTTDLPVTNLMNDIVRRAWRTAGTTQECWALYDLGTTQDVTMLAIFGISSNVNAITVEGNDSDSWGSPPFAVGMTIPSDADGVAFEKAVSFAQGTYRFWRITIDGVSDGTYWEIGRFAAGEYWQPTVEQDIETSKSLVDPSVINQADGQQYFSRQRDKYYIYGIQQKNLDNVDLVKWEALMRNRGNTKPLIASFDPTHTTRYNHDTIYCRLTTPLDYSTHLMMEYATVVQTFTELW